MGTLALVHLGTLDNFATLASAHALLAITSTVVTAAVVSGVCVCVCVCVCVVCVCVCVCAGVDLGFQKRGLLNIH